MSLNDNYYYINPNIACGLMKIIEENYQAHNLNTKVWSKDSELNRFIVDYTNECAKKYDYIL